MRQREIRVAAHRMNFQHDHTVPIDRNDKLPAHGENVGFQRADLVISKELLILAIHPS